MAYIQQRGERKYKITVCNGYTTTGKKRMQARTIDVPKEVPKDAAPTDGCAEDLHTHLSKQSDVLFVVMVKIDATAVGVVGSVHILQCLFKLLCKEGTAVVFGLYLFPIPAGIQIPQILGGYSFAPVLKAAFCLGAGDCTAPQKTFLKSLFHA